MLSKVLIVEDHPMLRQMLELFVGKMKAVEVCGSCENGEQALPMIQAAHPDLLLIDISLPGMSGLDLLGKVSNRHPEVLCVIFSGHLSATYVDRAREAGAKAYVVKSELLRLEKVLSDVLKGQSYFSGAD